MSVAKGSATLPGRQTEGQHSTTLTPHSREDGQGRAELRRVQDGAEQGSKPAANRLRNRPCTYSAAGPYHTPADSHALTQNRLEIARLKAQVAILLRVAHVTADELPRLLARVAQDDPVVLPVPRAPVPTAVDRDEWDEPHSLMSLCRAAEASDASSETSDLAPRGDGSRYWRAPSADETHAPSSSADSRASSLASFSGNLSMSVYGRASLAPGELQQILTKVPSVSGNGHSSRAGSSPVPSLGM